MLLKIIFAIFIINYFGTFVNGYVKVGLILKKGDEKKGLIVEHALNSVQTTDSKRRVDIRVVKETVEQEDTVSYHRAFCNLLASEIDVLISSAVSPYYPVLSAYASEYHIPFISPELPQEVSQFSTNYSFGIKPITSRPMLKLFQQYGWRDIVYLYDNDDGPENLNLIFTVGRHILNLTLDGILRVTSAKEANNYLRMLDKTHRNKSFHVVLDTELEMARTIIWLHVNDIHVRKKNFHFLFSKPTLKEFWISQMPTFGAINVTTFLIENQLPEAEIFLRQLFGESQDIDITSYYYYDAALVVEVASFTERWMNAFDSINSRRQQIATLGTQSESPNCLDPIPRPRPRGYMLSRIIQTVNLNGTTGYIKFQNGKRDQHYLNITDVTPRGLKRVAYWHEGNLYPEVSSRRDLPIALPLIQTSGRLQVVTIITPPYMMFKSGENGSTLEGNNRFEGYCKDMLDELAREMNFEYDLHLVQDNTYGIYKKSVGKWTGMIGELIQGKADLAVADLTITGSRQRVVEFTDPFEMMGFSLVMKNPRSVSKLSNILFFLSAFTADVWICIIFSAILFCVLFHFITKFTGAPDSIESASGIWGRKHAAVVNIWFAIGTSMFQGTGVYPRSISSRILTGFYWFFTLILSSMFIASITAQIMNSRLTDDKNPQLTQIQSLSLESIIAESVSRGWPKIGVMSPSNVEKFVKKTSIPVFQEFAKYLENNPDVTVSKKEEGIQRVRDSSGNYVVLLESLTAEYAIRRKPCDIIATHDSIQYAGNGLATPLGSPLMIPLNDALHKIQARGTLGDLYRKWWIETSECKNVLILENKERTIHVFSGLLCVTAFGILIALGAFGIQYIRRNESKESRRQQLSFEDMNLGQSLPTPPPELLAEPPPVLNLPEYDKKTLL